MKIEGLRKYDGKNPNGYFNDLPPQARMAAWRWLGRMEAKRRSKGQSTPPWVRALLIGNAKRLALMSDEERSAWGRSMLAKRGGIAVQRKYAADGRVGKHHPANHATRVRVLKQQGKKRAAYPGAGHTSASRIAGV
jgi:hypothetical protein